MKKQKIINLNDKTMAKENMKTIKELLAEVEIRFGKDWEKCELLTSSRGTSSKLNNFNPLLQKDMGCNRYGSIYHFEFGYHWATAKITEKPENWVIERDEQHPMWGQLIEWLSENMAWANKYKPTRYIGNQGIGEDLHAYNSSQYLTLDQWAELFLPKVDFSILNDTDWFYLETGGFEWLIKGGKFTDKEIVEFEMSYDFKDDSLEYDFYLGNNALFKVEHIKLLRLATPEDLAPFFKKHPEFAPPKEGDWCLFWDDNKDNLDINKFKQFHERHPNYPFEALQNIYYENCHKLSPKLSKMLEQEIKNFKTKNHT